ncbi:MAG: methyltransferase domain-containing protein, partial [Hyphomicrobiaceae bacterium]|nr:methyltransferase domain-containing protein [Hyphomicrobiaceae bacterium]
MKRPQVHKANADQATYWSGAAGLRWIARQETLDIVLEPIQAILSERAAVATGERVIDVGCGCGASSIALARRVGPTGRVTGVDISAPMLARARQQAPADLPLEFVLADATVHPFEPGAADLLVSRFGVMFFADPVVSFRNMRNGLRPGGRVTFACWRALDLNPWMHLPLLEALKHVAAPPRWGPDEPGPFAFAREERVRGILEGAGYSAVGMEAVGLALDLAAGKGLEAAVWGALA